VTPAGVACILQICRYNVRPLPSHRPPPVRQLGGRQPHRSTVGHSHLISLGSLPQEWTVDERRAFWDRVYQKLAPLDCARRAVILEAIHVRIPKLTPTEMQVEQAQRVAAETQRIEAEIQRHLSLAACKRTQIAELRKAIAAHKRAAAKAEAARKRLTQINPLIPATAAADLQGIADVGPFCN